MRIIVDGMGGDNAPEAIVKGAVEAVNEYGIDILIAGGEDVIKEELEKHSYPAEKIQILDAPEIITNDDNPTLAIRRKKNSSMVKGMQALADGEGDGFISAGNTGALLAGGIFVVKRIQGIDRAALTVLYPTLRGASLLVDAGANMDTKPEYLEQFAMMGSIYMEEVMGVKEPRVGLVNVGAEETKGNQLAKDTFMALKGSNINFIGNIEGRDLPYGAADVMVCDGFVGNVVLKLTEGMASSIFSILKESFMADTRSKLGALLLKPQLKRMKKRLDYREYGGAPLLGTVKPVVKAHGSSDYYAFKNGIGQLKTFIESDVIGKIENKKSI
ncbi:phosphate acyltransferase PlsX [Gudongella sp. SC589]|jgi:glycerol-3-phosphate acyltransferase PlsX|uniref:phosphate acyltransferase PlsX n=1 Tax=Gudongella sp. SC589 TaxID=3385990 RepID=UPI0039048351